MSLIGLVAAIAAVISVRLSVWSALITGILISAVLVASGLIGSLRTIAVCSLAGITVASGIWLPGSALAASRIHSGIAPCSFSRRLSVIIICMSSNTAARDSLRIILFIGIVV